MFLKMNCSYEGELKWDTIRSFQSFYFSFHFPAGLSQVQQEQMTCQKGSDVKEISNLGKPKNLFLENLSILLRLVKNWLVKYWCGIREKEELLHEIQIIKIFQAIKCIVQNT